jgi:hypothetical protein
MLFVVDKPFMLSVTKLNVAMLNVVMMSAMKPILPLCSCF